MPRKLMPGEFSTRMSSVFLEKVFEVLARRVFDKYAVNTAGNGIEWKHLAGGRVSKNIAGGAARVENALENAARVCSRKRDVRLVFNAFNSSVRECSL